MPELPEIHRIARQMNDALTGKRVASIEVRQPKCLNMPPAELEQLLLDRSVERVDSRGKWIFIRMSGNANLLLSLGMGGDVRLHATSEELPEKYQAQFGFGDGSCLSIGFWWFGYIHGARDVELPTHKMSASLGLNPLSEDEFTFGELNGVLSDRRGAIKALLLNQRLIAGIGNVYVQDILFDARIHPSRSISSLDDQERHRLYEAIRTNLREASELGGLKYERGLYGEEGQFESFKVGYREGQPCPVCGTTIVKEKIAGTASYLCPHCQV